MSDDFDFDKALKALQSGKAITAICTTKKLLQSSFPFLK